jgi:hypothetical protein
MKKGKTMGYQRKQTPTSSAPFAGQSPPVTRVKTDGRIGSVTPPSMLKGGFTVDNNTKAGPPGRLGSKVATHVSPGHQGGNEWSPRVKKARAMAHPNPKAYANPVNQKRGSLIVKKPD